MAATHPMLEPYRPSDREPFDPVKAAHLLNRAGFGGTPEEVERLRQLGPEKAVEQLLDFPDKSAEDQSSEEGGGKDVPDLTPIADYPTNFRDLQKLLVGKSQDERKAFQMKLMQANRLVVLHTAGWWLNRMARGRHPLQEKLTLFWHGHFTTSARDERLGLLMWNQNELLRRSAAGDFKQFVRQVSRDPAMLDYLNNQQNRKGHPNENYARELMELFTLGIGNYTEQDVREGARAFTGWGHDGVQFVFRRFLHDDGPKTFLGKTGNFDGDDIIDTLFAHPALPTYIAGRLLNYFVSEEVDPAVAASLGEVFKANDFQLRPTLRTLFTSKLFYAPETVGVQIKSPVQLVAGTVRLLGVEMPPVQGLFGVLNLMGQEPLMPPNVKGWPGGRAWINASTLFVRYNTAVRLAGGAGPVGPAGGGAMMARMRDGPFGRKPFDPKGADTVEQAVDQWLTRLIPRPVAEEKRKVLADALDGNPNDADSVRRMVQLIVSMPEYQLC